MVRNPVLLDYNPISSSSLSPSPPLPAPSCSFSLLDTSLEAPNFRSPSITPVMNPRPSLTSIAPTPRRLVSPPPSTTNVLLLIFAILTSRRSLSNSRTLSSIINQRPKHFFSCICLLLRSVSLFLPSNSNWSQLSHQFRFRNAPFRSPMEMATSPRTVEEIFKDYGARRAAVVRALTYDVDEFYGLCDPEKENLCLYGHPNETWEVTLPAEEVPPELPEPALGINFARDGMNRKDWLSLVAVHSDSWLLSVAFYFGARLNRSERKRLFSLINDLPTVFEVVTDRKPAKDKPSVDSGSKSRGSTKRSGDGMMKSNPKLADESFEEEDDEHSETLCGSCGGNYNADEFWIGCDICERWFHGKCVKITPAKAENIKQYKCPSCSLKRSRQ